MEDYLGRLQGKGEHRAGPRDTLRKREGRRIKFTELKSVFPGLAGV